MKRVLSVGTQLFNMNPFKYFNALKNGKASGIVITVYGKPQYELKLIGKRRKRAKQISK